ncbi:Nif-specific regulatory protein [Pelotomaculum propionicicum]|uniref:HTH-type transcriptional regulatory protein TyrR n=1 Tax=Pelotomaculum propionicicum TaxID=258475 RepID=A0A4Y7RMJ1_9FIRM|nr:Nif-specific regulatory protein [Pelotomaculum propionicicum]
MIFVDRDSCWDELNEQRELVEELVDTFNSSLDEIFIIDGSGNTKRINKAGETYYGVPVESLLGKNVVELEKAGYFSPSVARLVLKEKKRLTITQKTKSGKQLITTGNPIFNENGDIIRIVVNSRDISELLNLKKQLESAGQLAESHLQQHLKPNQLNKSNELVAQSPQMKAIIEMLEKVAKVDSTVLIMGESGTGKGVIASRLHSLGKRSNGPFITINCGTIPENLLESEFFGYEKGAFTGKRREVKTGLLELASGGTVFLDEITALPLGMQVRLLQVIQEKRLTRVGGSEYINVDIRFIAATNRDILAMVSEGTFREDLYYKLNVIPVIIPPLRSRQEDIPALAHFLLNRLNTKYNTNKKFSTEVINALKNYSWPGNVRELENLVERLFVTVEASEIMADNLPEHMFEAKSSRLKRVYILDIFPLKEAVEELEKQMVTLAYTRHKNTYKVAKVLNIDQSTVVRKIQKYNITGNFPSRQR